MVTKQEVEEIVGAKLSEQADFIQQGFNDVSDRIDGVETSLRAEITGLHSETGSLRTEVVNLRSEMRRGFQAADRRIDSLCDRIDDFMKLHGVFASELKETNRRMDRFEQAYPLSM